MPNNTPLPRPRDELDPNWTASTAMADRLAEAEDFARRGLVISEAPNKVAQLYQQERRIAIEAGRTFDDFETWLRARAAQRIQQGYTPLIPPPEPKPSLFRRLFGRW